MSVVNIFEKASRLKLRFASNKGSLSVEDLWDLSLTALDTIAKAVNKSLKEENEESFIGKKSAANAELTLKLDILKSVIATKQEEQERSKNRAEKRAQKEFLEQLLERKRINQLEGMSIEEIQAQLSAVSSESEE